jgi:hypothetical protein
MARPCWKFASGRAKIRRKPQKNHPNQFMNKSLPLTLAASILATGVGMSAVILPAYVAGDSSPDSYSTATPDQLVNSAGLSEAVPDGDTVAHALTVTHNFSGRWQESWVTSGHKPDYFAAAGPATIVFDLGSDQSVGSIILWQYGNNGGSSATAGARDGNGTMTMNIRFNTEAEGSSSFASSPTTAITMKEVWLGLSGVNSAQAFALPTPTARYVQIEVTDNYYGQPNIVAGGDRAGLGEVRFATEVVPEPSATTLVGALCLLGLLRRRR